MKVKFTDLYKLIPQKKKILSKLSYLIKKSKFNTIPEIKYNIQLNSDYQKTSNFTPCL